MIVEDVNRYPYSSGLIVGADGRVYDLAKLISGANADTGLTADIRHYPYHSALVVDSSGNVRDVTAMLSEARCQMAEMPDAGEAWNNRIIQYTGQTDDDFTQGHFYLCSETNGVYAWNELAVESGASVVGTTLNLK